MNFSWCYAKRLRAVSGSGTVEGSDVQLANTGGCDGCLCYAGYRGGAGDGDSDITNGSSVLTEDNDASEGSIDSTGGAVVYGR